MKTGAVASENVTDLLLSQGRATDVAIIDTAGPHTYDDLRRAVGACMALLSGWNLSRGARIGLIGHNSFGWVASYLAVMRAGHTVVPYTTVLAPDEVAQRAEQVGCSAMLLDRTCAGRYASALLPETHVIEEISWPSGSMELPPAAPPAPEAALLFTSGTTGRPRAVCVGHENIAANTISIVEYLDLHRDDRMLVVLPFAYCYGASLLHTHLRVGASVRLCNTLTYPTSVLRAIAEDSCTGFAGVPSTYQLLLRASTFGSEPLPTLRHLQQAGGRLPTPQIQQVRAAQPQARLFVMYGQTEATARLSYLPPELLDTKLGSIGRGIPGVTLRVAGESGEDLPAGAVGEIRARGANVTHGYWEDPTATACKFVDGELRTGDLARADEDGFIYVVDRSEDFLKPWGHRVSSAEIEEAVLTLRDVTSAAVVGRPDEVAGEAVVLFCEVAMASAVGPDEILSHCRAVLPRHMVPHEVHVLDGMPLNAHGKVIKGDLRQRALAAATQ